MVEMEGLKGKVFMEFLKDLGRTMGNTVNLMADKAKEVVEVTKLNGEINREERNIESTFAEIGKIIFEMEKDNPQSLVAEQIQRVLASRANIDTLRTRIRELEVEDAE